MQVSIGIPSCIYPQGLNQLLASIYNHTQHDYFNLTVLLDGNEGYKRLDQMPKYLPMFSKLKIPNDTDSDLARIERQSPDVKDYGFLPHYEMLGGCEVIRNPERLGVIGAWNVLANHLLAKNTDYIIILNDDIKVGPHWLDYLLTVLNNSDALLVSYGSEAGGKPAFPGLKKENIWGPCLAIRVSALREMIGDRPWVFNPQWKLFNADVNFIFEILSKGYKITSIADPLAVTADWHKSLGHWVYDESVHDKQFSDYPPVKPGSGITYVKMNNEFQVSDTKFYQMGELNG